MNLTEKQTEVLKLLGESYPSSIEIGLVWQPTDSESINRNTFTSLKNKGLVERDRNSYDRATITMKGIDFLSEDDIDLFDIDDEDVKDKLNKLENKLENIESKIDSILKYDLIGIM